MFLIAKINYYFIINIAYYKLIHISWRKIMGKIQDFTFLKEIEQSKRILQQNTFCSLNKHFSRISVINEEPLKIAIMGECSAGKSTFINKLINNDKEILPTGFIPVTSTITKLYFGETEKIEIKRVANNQIETKEHLGYEQLESYQKAADSTDVIYSEELKRIKEIKVYINNPLLKSFIIIDTPGFNQNETISNITKSIFDEVDFIIWLTKGAVISQSEEQELKEIMKYNKEIYCVNNFADTLKDESSKDSFSNNLKEKYTDIFINTNQIHFISCDPQLNNDPIWKQNFQNLLQDLEKQVLSKDIEISKKLIKKEYFLLKNEIESNINLHKSIGRNISEIISKKINAISEGELRENLNQKIIEISEKIEEKLELSKKQLLQSKANQKDIPKSLLEFYAQSMTYEILNDLESYLKEVYENIMTSSSKILIIILDEIKTSYENNDNLKENYPNIILQINRLKVLAETSFISSHKLLIIGGLFGVLSDNYLFKLMTTSKSSLDFEQTAEQIVEKGKNLIENFFNKKADTQNKSINTSEILAERYKHVGIVAKVTINELLERDFNIDYFIKMMNELNFTIQNSVDEQINLLNIALSELKEVNQEMK